MNGTNSSTKLIGTNSAWTNGLLTWKGWSVNSLMKLFAPLILKL